MVCRCMCSCKGWLAGLSNISWSRLRASKDKGHGEQYHENISWSRCLAACKRGVPPMSGTTTAEPNRKNFRRDVRHLYTAVSEHIDDSWDTSRGKWQDRDDGDGGVPEGASQPMKTRRRSKVVELQIRLKPCFTPSRMKPLPPLHPGPLHPIACGKGCGVLSYYRGFTTIWPSTAKKKKALQNFSQPEKIESLAP